MSRPSVGSRLVECGTGIHRKRAAGIKPVVVEITKGRTMEAIAAAAGKNVHRAAGIASVLGVGGAGGDAELLPRTIHLEGDPPVACAGDVIPANPQETICRRAPFRPAEEGPR